MEKRSAAAWPVLGLVLGLGFLFKYTILLLPPALLLYAWRRRGSMNFPRIMPVRLALCANGFAASIAGEPAIRLRSPLARSTKSGSASRFIVPAKGMPMPSPPSMREKLAVTRLGSEKPASLFPQTMDDSSVTEPAGSDTFVSMLLGGKDVIARMRSDAEVKPGTNFTFAVNMEKAVAFDPATEMRIVP